MGKGAVYHDNRERVDKSGVIFLVEWSIRNLAGTISPAELRARLREKWALHPRNMCFRCESKRRGAKSNATQKGLKQVASAAGFGNVDVMRRAFVRLLGLTPRRYRDLAVRSSSV